MYFKCDEEHQEAVAYNLPRSDMEVAWQVAHQENCPQRDHPDGAIRRLMYVERPPRLHQKTNVKVILARGFSLWHDKLCPMDHDCDGWGESADEPIHITSKKALPNALIAKEHHEIRACSTFVSA